MNENHLPADCACENLRQHVQERTMQKKTALLLKKHELQLQTDQINI